MAVGDQQLAAVPSNAPLDQIAELRGQIAALQSASGGGFLVGDYAYTSNVPANWNTPGAVIQVGNRMVPNGTAISRTAYPDLNAIYAANGYLFGTGDGSTTFNIPDVLGRAVWCVGTNADIDLGDNDGNLLASRSPKHKTSSSLSLTGAPDIGTLAISAATVANSGSGNAGTTGSGNQSFAALTGAPGIGSLAVSGSVGATGSRPTDTPSFIVAGIWMLIVLP